MSIGAQKLVTVVWSGLAGEVRHVRNRRNLSLEVVCDQLGWQQSKLSRMERGQQCISAADLASLLVIYKVTGGERNRLLHLVERQDEPGRWMLESPLEPTPLMHLEADAIALVNAEPLLMPGLVQTADYIIALAEAENVPPEVTEQRLQVTEARQLLLTKANPPKFDIILDETVLRRTVGSQAIMARQLRALLEVAGRPNVRLWVVPADRAANVGFNWPFYTLSFPRGESVVQLESQGSVVYIEDQAKIEFFQRHAAKVGKVALTPAESVALVATLTKEA
ncbi:MAG TPA: helix-turn-helix transcriptional regulator [Pseudonocardiaceae bacterium]|nr:helix-turn-helix transcriptional regulator [Pseudonocardiaceae bacterium]